MNSKEVLNISISKVRKPTFPYYGSKVRKYNIPKFHLSKSQRDRIMDHRYKSQTTQNFSCLKATNVWQILEIFFLRAKHGVKANHPKNVQADLHKNLLLVFIFSNWQKKKYSWGKIQLCLHSFVSFYASFY